jgi:hypothetical protein
MSLDGEGPASARTVGKSVTDQFSLRVRFGEVKQPESGFATWFF